MKSIFVSAGHSNTDPGAAANGLTEAAVVTEFRNMVSFYLYRAGVQHGTDGDGAENMPLKTAAMMARHYDIAVEFHCNAGPEAATGVETLSGQLDTALGMALCKAISDAIGIRIRGAKPEASGQHSRLAFVQAGGIIVELFFLTNKADIAAYNARKWVAARAVADVLAAAAR